MNDIYRYILMHKHRERGAKHLINLPYCYTWEKPTDENSPIKVWEFDRIEDLPVHAVEKLT